MLMNYSYDVINKVVVIRPTGSGKTITNSVESIIHEIKVDVGSLFDHRVIYEDTDKRWDEIVVKDDEFSHFNLINKDSFKDAFGHIQVKDFFEKMGYFCVRELNDNTWVGLTPLIFTTGLCMGMDMTGWAKRYCFDHRGDAVTEILKLNSIDDEPTGWIAKRG